MHVGEKNDDPCHLDYVPTIFKYIKFPEKNRAKQQRQLEKYEVDRSMKKEIKDCIVRVRQGECTGRE